MPNYRRLYVPGGTYAFTLCLHDRRADTLIRYIEALRASYHEVTARHPLRTIAICVLPDHMHLLWALPDGDCDFVNRLRLIKAGFTRRLPAHLKSVGRKGERRIWQSRYWEHVIRGGSSVKNRSSESILAKNDLAAHMDYIHWNPVKHGLVASPEAWPHSSWHRYKDSWNREWNPDTPVLLTEP
ncbi:REP-associated tyrosine transposase [Henriciella pelagia]|jgi:putative transposase|uniref:Transposase n=1 Tax=Henriciella pelagia TaxID=1977912 RepID=A0ABQ1JQB5_9PROT|nr:transposase [Henriciella pelagia]GGB74912.1 transposase [Henriciella pelagia]